MGRADRASALASTGVEDGSTVSVVLFAEPDKPLSFVDMAAVVTRRRHALNTTSEGVAQLESGWRFQPPAALRLSHNIRAGGRAALAREARVRRLGGGRGGGDQADAAGDQERLVQAAQEDAAAPPGCCPSRRRRGRSASSRPAGSSPAPAGRRSRCSASGRCSPASCGRRRPCRAARARTAVMITLVFGELKKPEPPPITAIQSGELPVGRCVGDGAQAQQPDAPRRAGRPCRDRARRGGRRGSR